tara:strand:+ start:105 stop:359 length:255 start_codon:yes stop_codon:yes gene_type:complete
MKKFDERPLEEKINIIIEDKDLIENQSWNEGIGVKLLVLAPLIIFVTFGIVFYSKDDSIGIIAIIFLPFICITLGVYIYSIMIR